MSCRCLRRLRRTRRTACAFAMPRAAREGVDRIALVVKNLRAMGAEVVEHEDGMDVPGGQTLHGGGDRFRAPITGLRWRFDRCVAG